MMCGMANTTQRIANRVRGVAAEHRFTQARIADVLSLSRTSVVERFNGRVPFTAPELFELSTAMGIPVSTFFPASTFEAVAA
jgi:transcriptional regulator with XRE-family HTH domain